MPSFPLAVAASAFRRRALSLFAIVLLAIAIAPPTLHAQATGTIRGTVTDAGTGTALAGVQVFVVGLRRGTITTADGHYAITGVALGSATVRAQRIGYTPAQQEVQVTPDEPATANLKLSVTALTLDQIVVTGTPGATNMRVLGNVVATVDAAQLTQAAAMPSVSELLQGRAAGVNVRDNAGSVGTASNIIIRGASSLSANFNPVVYIDGVRMNADVQVAPGNTGGTVQATSAMSAIDPNDIESIEVIKGPAAATLYGADAASGVIQIITKKGRIGQQGIQWNAHAETGPIEWALARPKTYWYCTDAEIAAASSYPNCAALGASPANRMLIDDPFNQPGALRVGSTNNFGLSAQGGSDRYSFFASAEHDAENGVWYNNHFLRNNGRANLQVSITDNLDLSVNTSYAQTGAMEPLADNSSNSILRNGYRDRPSGPYQYQPQFRGFGPALANQYNNQVSTDRFILSSTLNQSLSSWFHHRLTLGADVNNQTNFNFYTIDTTGKAVWGASVANGYVLYDLPTTHDYTVDYAATVTSTLPRGLSSSASAGVQYLVRAYHSWTTIGQGLVANSLNLVGAAATTSASESFSQQKSFGTYVQEQIGWRDLLYVTGAVRVDNNSAFGSNFKLATYPKASVSYIISDEPWFHLPKVDQLKLRAAWGEAGNVPAPFSAVRAYTTTQTIEANVPVNALTPSTYGNPNLHAEKGNEIEVGFDASAFKQRIGLEFTYYSKLTQDALITVPAPPSTGYTGNYLTNIGEIKNAGLEATLTATVLQRRNFSWESDINLSTNHNKLVTFGTNALSPIIFGTFAGAQEFAPGYPLGGFFGTDVARDASGNPVLTNGKVTLDAAKGSLTPTNQKDTYLGPSTPTIETSWTNTISLGRSLTLYGFLDYKGGYYQFDGIKYVNDRLDQNTRDVNNPAYFTNGASNNNVYRQYLMSGATRPDIVRADFIKLREVSVTYALPTFVAAKFRATRASLQVSGRNLSIWKLKGYPGLDPEVEFYSASSTTSTARFDHTDYASTPMLRRIVFSMNLTF